MHYGEATLSRVAGHPNLTLIREDFRHIEALTRAVSGVGSVIHLGGLVGDPACAVDTDLTVDVNVTATKVIGEIAKARGVRRFIFASSCSVYGACDEVVNEEAHFNPQSLYARSKVASEAVLKRLNDRDFAVTCLRFSTIYGISGRTRFDLVVNLLCAKAVRDGAITVYGGKPSRACYSFLSKRAAMRPSDMPLLSSRPRHRRHHGVHIRTAYGQLFSMRYRSASDQCFRRSCKRSIRGAPSCVRLGVAETLTRPLGMRAARATKRLGTLAK